jgi:hypothetical protein
LQNDDWKKLPKYFQVGTVVAGAGEYYSGRLTKKERAPTLVDQLLKDDQVLYTIVTGRVLLVLPAGHMFHYGVVHLWFSMVAAV